MRSETWSVDRLDIFQKRMKCRCKYNMRTVRQGMGEHNSDTIGLGKVSSPGLGCERKSSSNVKGGQSGGSPITHNVATVLGDSESKDPNTSVTGKSPLTCHRQRR